MGGAGGNDVSAALNRLLLGGDRAPRELEMNVRKWVRFQYSRELEEKKVNPAGWCDRWVRGLQRRREKEIGRQTSILTARLYIP